MACKSLWRIQPAIGGTGDTARFPQSLFLGQGAAVTGLIGGDHLRRLELNDALKLG